MRDLPLPDDERAHRALIAIHVWSPQLHVVFAHQTVGFGRGRCSDEEARGRREPVTARHIGENRVIFRRGRHSRVQLDNDFLPKLRPRQLEPTEVVEQESSMELSREPIEDDVPSATSDTSAGPVPTDGASLRCLEQALLSSHAGEFRKVTEEPRLDSLAARDGAIECFVGNSGMFWTREGEQASSGRPKASVIQDS